MARNYVRKSLPRLRLCFSEHLVCVAGELHDACRCVGNPIWFRPGIQKGAPQALVLRMKWREARADSARFWAQKSKPTRAAGALCEKCSLAPAAGSSIELSFQSCRTLEEIALLGGGEEPDETETGEMKVRGGTGDAKVGEEAGDHLSSTAEAAAGEKTITIDVTIQRMDPAEFVNEEEDMVRFRRLGCTRNSLNIRV